MNELINWTKEVLTNKRKPTEAPKTHCPSCWGRQEYGGDFFDAVKQENIDTNNVEAKKGWIVGYAEKNLTGIVLKQESDDNYVCNNCKVAYKKA